MLTRRHLLGGLAGLTTGFAVRPTYSAEFPSRPIVIVVPYPAGGPVDAVARLIAQDAAAELGQPIAVDNRSGGSGVIGTVAVARAEPDGHMLVLGTSQTHITNHILVKNCPYHGIKDFAPVCGIAEIPHVLVVRKDLPVTSAAEFLAFAKRSPAALTCGSTGTGSASHLTAELFKVKAGVDLVHVPFRGAAPMITELLAGRIDFSFATLAGVAAHIEAGSVRALAVASDKRSPRIKALPTLKETGISGVEADAWIALFAPAKTPAPVVDRLHRFVTNALQKSPAVSLFDAQGMRAAITSPHELMSFLPSEDRKWASVIETAHIAAE
ncbi:MAG TPA: tripartite tricarboxylate transporter substrate binding protein [Xanthobacteraceae bacterium]|jgi:tripartite-type tricarboxylate transporter receptor subunit TctC|nr:tripartite tricarboxylate transporter substrate binding protein [Xanthobacteraceae bacterium]